jgi:hypothetical protein
LAVAILWLAGVAMHPENMSPFRPLAWQLPALQGYFTGIVSHVAVVLSLKTYDRVTGYS